MKLTLSTPTRTTTGTTLLRAFLNRFVPIRRRTYPIIQVGTGGFSFGIFALVGALQPKEVVIQNMGHHLLSSKSRFNFSQRSFS